MPAEQVISTTSQTVTIKTRRGLLRVGPHGRIDGLWQICERELRTNEQVRRMCRNVKRRGGIPSTRPVERHTLAAWRRNDNFPEPVWIIKAHGNVELWSRTDVEDWLAARS